MMKIQNSKKQESQWGAARRRAGWLAAFGLVLALAWVFGWSVSQRHRATAPMLSGNSGSSALANPFVASKGLLPAGIRDEATQRIVYPFSIIPGGVRSIDDLRSAIASDPVVSAQYAAFRMEYARILRLDRELKMHVSYRRGDQIYWTEREIKLSKGEIIITDGSETALARCGNLVADVVEDPVSPNEPTEHDLNTPIPTSYGPVELESDNRFPGIQFVSDPYVPPAGTGLRPSGGPTPNAFVPSGPPGPIPYPGGPTPPPVVKTPEPGTAILLLAGLLALLFVQWRRTKGAPRSET